ncbi:hypothetical protein BDB01DRAFT_847936 [Pilobolus umbonatus]|nr:hypothetical protein BDB01DRAFT_847936 [Pilobolus umbonatus]
MQHIPESPLQTFTNELEAIKTQKYNIDAFLELCESVITDNSYDISYPKQLETKLEGMKNQMRDLFIANGGLRARALFEVFFKEDTPLNIDIDNLPDMTISNTALKNQISESVDRINQLKETMFRDIDKIERMKHVVLNKINEVSQIVMGVAAMESDLSDIKSITYPTIDITVDEAKLILQNQMNSIRILNQSIKELSDSKTQETWEMEDIKEELDDYKQRKEIVMDKLAEIDKITAKRDPLMEDKYNAYQQKVKEMNRLFSIKDIKFNSNTDIHLTYTTENSMQLKIDPETDVILEGQVKRLCDV